MKHDLKLYKPSGKILIRSGMILFGTILVVIVLEIRERCFEEEITRIERNDYGDGIRKEQLKLEIDGEEEQTVVLEISPRSFSDEEIEKLFLEAIKELEFIVPGENKNLEHVTKDLNLVHTLEGYPFIISWQFSRYDIVDMSGRIQKDKLAEVDPEREGIPLTVTAILRYEMEESICNMNMVIFPPEEKMLSISEEILESVSQINNQTKEEMYVTLPDVIDGKKVVWKKEEKFDTAILLALGGATSILLIFLEKQREKEAEKKKREQMLLDYSEIVGQFIVLMGAGMTSKNVWKRMVEDYQKQKSLSDRTRWAYEEMEITWKEMQNGVPELECYERFAKRCELLPYVKLGALLAQNLKRGTKGLWLQMEMEAHQAMNDRKNQIKRLGEEAGTKLLMPMLLMLVMVLLIVIVPAFLSIQI